MNRDYYDYVRNNSVGTNNVVPQYSGYMTDSNVDLISEEVTKLVKERFPRDQPFKVANSSIKDAMWEVYQHQRQHAQVMIQMVINLLTEQVILQKEALETTYDPHILDTPELFGITSYNSGNIKLNNRRNEPIQFTYHM
jgi:hypothetical protein